jgi:hypothetical protein
LPIRLRSTGGQFLVSSGEQFGVSVDSTAPPWLGDRPLSPAEDRILRVRGLAEEFWQAGDEETAEALLQAIVPKRGRGRPPEWTDAQLFDLAIEVGEVLRSKPRLTGTSAIAIVAGRSRWSGWTQEALRSRFTDFAARSGWTFKQAIDGLRGGPRPAD